LGRGKLELVIIGDIDHYHVEARYIVPFSLSFDHRLNDGGDAARFLATFRSILSDTDQLTLHA
jgi:pyruvate dehydrogenase E2 component (dihydrolipoamide acetyltransferase)